MCKKAREAEEVFEIWDRGDHTFGGAMDDLLKLKSGEEIGDIMKGCTICPVLNATCPNYMEIKLYGFHPKKDGVVKEIWICSIGVKNIDDCPLSK